MQNIEVNIQDALKEHFTPFAGEILVNNLPSIDGCLPAHRKIMLAMYRNGRLNNKPYTKSTKVLGEIVTYYVFGDRPLYGVMVNMANNSANIPYIDGYGEWGEKFSSEGVAAAARYTECRMTKYAESMIEGLNKNAVPMKPNFDNTTDEMIVMPSLPPNILLNTSQSIAVGEASRIYAHNVIETCDAFINYIHNKDINKAIEIIKCPDLSSGGQIVYDKKVFENIYKTGRGSFTVIGKYKVNEKANTVQIYEVPYETTIQAIEKKLEQAYEKGEVKEILNIRNSTGNSGLRLDITLKKNANVEQFITKLRKYTPFESKMSVNMTILDLDWRTPKLMSLEDIIIRWIKHRFNCISSELKFDINKKSKQLHNLKGLRRVLLDIDGVIKIIRNTSKDNEVVPNLVSHLQVDNTQAEYIAEIKLRNLNKEYIIKRTNEISTMEKEIESLQSTLNNPNKIKKIIIEQLEYVKKQYGQPRRTEIIDPEEIPTINTKEIEIEDYNTKVFVTAQGYLKKVPATSLRGNSQHKLKDDDSILQEFDSTNKSELLIFTSSHNCYKVWGYELEDTKLSNLGEYLPSLLQLEKDEKVLFVGSTTYTNEKLIIMFENGKLAKINIKDAFKTSTNRKKLAKAFSDKSEPVFWKIIKDDIDLVAQSSIDKVLLFNTSLVSEKSTRSSQGNQIMKSKDGSKVIGVYELDQCQFEDAEYYRGKTNAVGKYLKKGDSINH